MLLFRLSNYFSLCFQMAITCGMEINVKVFSGFSKVSTSSAHAITLPEKLEGGPQYTSTCSLIKCSEINFEINHFTFQN